MTAAVNDDLLARAEREAAAGAKVVFWAEGNAALVKSDEAAFVARGSQLAHRDGIYLGMAFYTWTPGAARPLENKLVMAAPDGSIALQYWKVHPTPGPEMSAAVATDGKLRILDTPFGRMASAICYDMDFPPLMAQAGKAGVDLVLSPANDWRAIDPRHTEIASFRAVEQGFNLVRQSSGGLSAAYDYQGHPLALVHGYEAAEGTLSVNVPTRGVRTVYSALGDWVVWASAAGLAVLIALGLPMRRRSGLQPAVIENI
jgi:apolipoprotein N-acyltransferase